MTPHPQKENLTQKYNVFKKPVVGFNWIFCLLSNNDVCI